MARRPIMLMRKKNLLGTIMGKYANLQTQVGKSIGHFIDGVGRTLKPIAGWTGNQGCSVGIAEAIIDDEDGVYVNTWTFSSFASGYYGIGYHHFSDGTNTGGSCTFPLPVEAVGEFEVYARWSVGSGRATAATFTVNHVDGSDDIVFDQNIDGAQFNLVGVFKLDLTSDVVLKSSDSGAVIADAIKIIRV